MRRLLLPAVALFLVSACGGGDDSTGGSQTTGTSGTQTTAGSGDLAGGATFRGTFTVEPGVGPGEISFVLDGEGTRIVTAVIDPALDEFHCPTGVIISGGGITGTYTPGIAIEAGSFDSGDLSGVFASSTEAHGTYSLEDSFDCPYEVDWTATSE